MEFKLTIIFFTFLATLFNVTIAGIIPEIAPATIGYTNVVPYNIPPHGSRIDISTRNLAAPVFAPASYVAAAPAPAFAPLVAAPQFSFTPHIPHLHYDSYVAPSSIIH